VQAPKQPLLISRAAELKISVCSSIRLVDQMLLMLFSENMGAKNASIITPGLSVKLVELDDLCRVASPTCPIASIVEL
jgi:hypothetical protein